MRTWPALSNHTVTVLPALVPARAGTSAVRSIPAAVQRAGIQVSQVFAPWLACSGPGTD
jgi:hypothetical protein